MRTKHGLFLGFAVLLLAEIFTGCPTDGDSGDDGGLDLPDITEETSGRETITVTAAALESEDASDASGVTIPSQTIGSGGGYGTWSVTAGKLTLTLNTPSGSDARVISDWFSNNGSGVGSLFGSVEGGNVVTVSDDTAQIVYVHNLKGTGNSTEYEIERRKYKTDNSTYSLGSNISYVYVDKDVTFTRAKKQIEETTYNAIALPLKTGWNLVQTDSNYTRTSSTEAVKIADKDIPWACHED
jgi:hypothetical protein